MKTGVIITSDDFKVKGDECIFENISLNSVRINGEDWRLSDNGKNVNPEDIKHYMELMGEGIATCIEFLASKGVDSDLNLLHGIKSRIDRSLFTACKIKEEDEGAKEFTGREININNNGL